MIHHDVIILEITPSISCSQGGIGIGYLWKDKDYFDLDVTPDSMSWTATLTDTGENTNWVRIVPSSGTGDETNMYAEALEDNPNTTPRSCEVTFSDDSGDAESITLTITQMAAPA